MTDQSHRTRHPDPAQPHLGRRRLMGASALAAAGWIAGGGGWYAYTKYSQAAAMSLGVAPSVALIVSSAPSSMSV
jgi:branched-chain amino acid transport system substrate-binding protein